MKNKVFERELELCRVESWQRVPRPERRAGTVWVKHAEFPGWAAAAPCLSVQLLAL